MAGILTLTVMNSKKLKEKINTAFSSEDTLVNKVIDDETILIENLKSDKESENLIALKAILKVFFGKIFRI